MEKRASPAPIDPELVEPVLAPFGSSFTLPSSAYTSDDVLAWEHDHFFSDLWACAGRLDDFPPGSARAVTLGPESLLVTTDEHTRVFFNVCRHRGHELIRPGAATETRWVRCPYHSWTYHLDGSLRTAPTFGASLDRTEFGLGEIRSQGWHGWLFVDLSGSAPDLAEQLGDLEDVLSAYRPEELVTLGREEYEVAANWKIIVENYQECYHCSTIHPALCRVSPPGSGRDLGSTGLWMGGPMELDEHAVTMSMSGASEGVMLPGISEKQRRTVLYLTVFPNLLISAHPDYVMTHRVIPVAPDRSRVICEWLFRSESTDPTYAIEFWDLTNRQDWTACEGVQRGVTSRGYRPGPLGTWEATLYRFLTTVAAGYREGRVKGSPRSTGAALKI